jgi:hypothetical protein
MRIGGIEFGQLFKKWSRMDVVVASLRLRPRPARWTGEQTAHGDGSGLPA